MSRIVHSFHMKQHEIVPPSRQCCCCCCRLAGKVAVVTAGGSGSVQGIETQTQTQTCMRMRDCAAGAVSRGLCKEGLPLGRGSGVGVGVGGEVGGAGEHDRQQKKLVAAGYAGGGGGIQAIKTQTQAQICTWSDVDTASVWESVCWVVGAEPGKSDGVAREGRRTAL
jgi:hypothetical protein